MSKDFSIRTAYALEYLPIGKKTDRGNVIPNSGSLLFLKQYPKILKNHGKNQGKKGKWGGNEKKS